MGAPLTTDLSMLTWTAVLALLMPTVYLTGRVMTPGAVQWGMGNREAPEPAGPAWAARAQRAHANLLESLPVFAALVLVAHVSGRAGELSALGATLFFWARVAHAAIYVAGIPVVRTLVFFVAMAGQLMVLAAILR